MTHYELPQLSQDELQPLPTEAERGRLLDEVPADVRKADQEYRQQLTNHLVETAVGTVGLHASMDLNKQGYDGMPGRNYGSPLAESLERRNPGKKYSFRGGGGWGSYGDRELFDGPDDTMTNCFAELGGNHEELHAMVMPDGSAEVRYGFTAQGYTDGTDRPGNRLRLGFTTSAEAANALLAAATSDPRVLNVAVEAQVKAVGIVDEYWARYLQPRYGFNVGEYKKDAERVLTVVLHNSDMSVAEERKVTYDEPRIVLPVTKPHEQPPQALEAAVSEAAMTREHAQSAREIITDMQQEGESPASILAYLAENVYEFSVHDMLSPGEQAASSEAYSQAFDEYFSDALSQQSSIEDKTGLVFDYMNQVLDSYVSRAVEQGRDLSRLGDFVHDDDSDTLLASIQLSALTDALRATPHANAVNDETIKQFLSIIIQNKTR